ETGRTGTEDDVHAIEGGGGRPVPESVVPLGSGYRPAGRSVQRLAGDRARFPAGEQPTAERRRERQPGEDGHQVRDGDVADRRAQAVPVVREGGHVRHTRSEGGSEHAEPTGGGAGEGTPDPAA